MPSYDNFTPTGATVTLAVSTTSANAARVSLNYPTADVRLYNAGTVPVFVEFGGSTVAATVAASMPLAPGATEIYAVNGTQTHVAAIVATGTATLYITTGRGS